MKRITNFQNNFTTPDFTPEVDQTEIEKRVQRDRLDAKNISTGVYYEYSEKPYAIEFKTANIVSSVFFYVFMFFSVIMALVPMGWFFQEVISQKEITDMDSSLETGYATLIAGLFLALIFLGGNEALKAISQTHALKKWFSQRKFTAAFLIWIVLIIISGTSSTWGAYTYTYKSRQAKKGDFVSTDSVKNYYESQIKEANAQIKSLQASKYQGKRTAQSLQNEEKIQSRLANLESSRDIAISNAEIKNENIKSGGETNGRAAGAIAVIVAILIETGLIGLGWFKASYKWNCELDRRKRSATGNDSRNNGFRNETNIKNQGSILIPSDSGTRPPSTQIGFHTINESRINESRNNESRSAVQNSTCNHCGKEYYRNHVSQKYCDENCKKKYWEKKTGRKLMLKKGGKIS